VKTRVRQRLGREKTGSKLDWDRNGRDLEAKDWESGGFETEAVTRQRPDQEQTQRD